MGGDIAFYNARLASPAAKKVEAGDLLVRGGKIAGMGAGLFARETPPEGAERIDCAGAWLMPAIWDMHVFAPDPAADHRENMESLSASALAGGVSDILLIPYHSRPQGGRQEAGGVRFHQAGALTQEFAGGELAEMFLARAGGAPAFSNGRAAIASALVMRRAMAYAASLGLPVLHHVEDPDLAAGGVMHEGVLSAALALTGIPVEAETLMLERDLTLARLTGAHYHAQQISSAAALPTLHRAKQEGLPVSCGTSVHHLLLDENEIGLWRSYYKLSPPLRGTQDRLALLEALKEGLVDVIVSAHDPQDQEAKRLPFQEAEAGAVGVETLLPAALALLREGVPLARLLNALIVRPAEILGLPPRKLETGAEASLVLCREEDWTLDAQTLHARCKNTPLDDHLLGGRVLLTLIEGEEKFRHPHFAAD